MAIGVATLLATAGKALLSGAAKKAAVGAVKSGAKNFVKDKAKNFITGKGRKKKSNRKVGAKEVTAIVQTGGSSLTVGKGVSGTPGASVPYSSDETKEKKSRSGTATYEKLGARLTNIVSLTETLDNLVKKQYSNTKKSAKRKRTAADKSEDARKEGLLEKGGKGLLGFAGSTVKKATGGFDFFNFLTNILLGGLAVGAINLIQKHGLGKGLSKLADNLKGILYGMRILKGALNSLGAIAWKTTKFAFGMVKKGIDVAAKGVKNLAGTITKGIGSLAKGIWTFSKKMFKGARNWISGITKYGRNIYKGLRQGKSLKDAVKVADRARKGGKGLGVVKDVAKGTKAARDVSKAAKGASKGAKAANAIVPFSRGAKGAKGAKGALPGAAPFLKRLAKIRGFGGVPVIGPVLTLVAGLLDPEVKVTQAIFRSIGTAIGEMVGTFVGGAIAAGTGGIGAIAVPLMNVTGALLGEYIGDMLYIGTMGGGWQSVQKKFGDDVKARLMDAINLGKFVGDGMARFYQGMPKYKLSDGMVDGAKSAANLLGIKNTEILDFLKDGIPDVGWWINPFNPIEKVKLFKQAFFEQNVQPGNEEKIGSDSQTWRDSLNEGDGSWTSPDGSPNSTVPKGSSIIPETASMAEVDRQTSGGSHSNISGGNADDMHSGARMIMGAGVPRKGAAYLAGNIQQESSWNGQRDWGQVMGDGTSRNGGLVSWASWSDDPARLGKIERHLGKNITKASDAEQINAMMWEMKKDYPSAYATFMNPNATDAQLRAASKAYWGYGHEGPRYEYAQKVYKGLEGVQPAAAQRAQSKPQTPAVPGAKGGSGAYASGLKTGPSARIGGSSEYHIDTKIKASLSMEQKIAMMDELSRGYAAQGRVIEFSNASVAGLVYSHNMSAKDKAALLNKVFAAHNLPRGRALDQGGFHSLDYYIPKSGETRFGSSVEGAEILVPSIDGGKLEYHTGGNYGRFVVGVDKDGNVLYKTGHGDSKLSANRGTVSFGRSRRGTTGAAVPTTPAVPQQTTPPKAPTLPPPAVPEATNAPPAPILPPPTVPEARIAPTKPQCDCSGVEKFTDYEVGGSFGAITLPIPITSTAGSGEGMVPKPQGPVGGIGGDVAGMVNSFWKQQLSSFLYKFG